jgi:oxalate decarboxylase/phosphoglucose isomerase-like protein (cupin superfamily)
MAAGHAIFIPGHEEHQMKNTGQEPLVVVCLVPSSAPEL